jgi:glucokinase
LDKLLVGVDLGGTKILSGLFDPQGRLVAEELLLTEAEWGMEHVFHLIQAGIDHLLQQGGVGWKQLGAIVVGAPGPVNSDTGCLYHAPNLGCTDVFLGRQLEEIYNVPVWLDNDANLAALGEYVYGYPDQFPIMLYITISTGVGGGIIMNGEVYRGADGGAGEFGHMVLKPRGLPCRCGARGCLETLASGTAVAREAQRLVASGRGQAMARLLSDDMPAIDARTVMRAAMEGDREARDILNRAFRYLGIGVANLVNVLNPHAVVIGGGLATHEYGFDIVAREVAKRTFLPLHNNLKILPSRLGARAGLMGCLATGLRKKR